MGLRMGNLIKAFGNVSDNGIEVGNLLLQENKLVTRRRDGWRVNTRRRELQVVGTWWNIQLLPYLQFL